MRRKISDDITNSEIQKAIEEYCRKERDREILKLRWIDGLTFDEIANECLISPRAAKRIVYDVGDKILIQLHKRKN